MAHETPNQTHYLLTELIYSQ